MDTRAIKAALQDVFDQAIVFHGFTDYMRDYEVIVYATADPRTGIRPEHVRLLFKHCVRAEITSAVRPDVWRRSLDERLIDYDQGVELDGYVWGVKWQELYPGPSLIIDSAVAGQWSRQLEMPFHEAVLAANGHNISLVFSDLETSSVSQGYTPFVVPDGGPDWKVPLP